MKISFFKILKFLFPLFIANSVIIGIFYYWFSDITFESEKDNNFIIGILLIVIIPIIPQLVLLINHYLYDKNTHICFKKNQLIINKNGKTITINQENICNWELVCTATKSLNSSIKYWLIDNLFFIKIYLKEEEEKPIKLSCLLDSKIDQLFNEHFGEFRENNQIRFFPYMED
ncbi:hypothetical protein AB4865_06150 [Capnocytophaga sp. ARDL2]|uniref:hypothetical protein n=1 Tax=Capnocytophaga sp. ARDL2 TaxID=3238809 RepID=UPI0035582A9B